MKLKINKVTFWLPTYLIKTKFICKMINKNNKNEIDINQIHKMMKKAFKILKQYKKNNGPLVLVDVQSADGDIVKIIV